MIPHPRCAVCDRPVDRLISYFDEAAAQHVLVALCHGAQERVTIPEDLLMSLQYDDITIGDAFTAKALPAPTQAIAALIGGLLLALGCGDAFESRPLPVLFAAVDAAPWTDVPPSALPDAPQEPQDGRPRAEALSVEPAPEAREASPGGRSGALPDASRGGQGGAGGIPPSEGGTAGEGGSPTTAGAAGTPSCTPVPLVVVCPPGLYLQSLLCPEGATPPATCIPATAPASGWCCR